MGELRRGKATERPQASWTHAKSVNAGRGDRGCELGESIAAAGRLGIYSDYVYMPTQNGDFGDRPERSMLLVYFPTDLLRFRCNSPRSLISRA